MTRRYPLNPCDYLYFAMHERMRRRGEGGNTVFMVIELEGRADPARLRAARDGLIAEHPVLGSRVRFGLVTSWPYWSEVERLDAECLTIREVEHERAAHAALEEEFARGADAHSSPPFRVQLLLGPGRSWITLNCPHALMDGTGGQLFFRELDRVARPEAQRGASLCAADGTRVDPLAERSILQKCRLFAKGGRMYRAAARAARGGSRTAARRHQSTGESGAVAGAAGTTPRPDWRFEFRRYSGDDWHRVREAAERCCPDGPARFSRYLAGCTMRALQRVREVRTEASPLLITLPVRPRTLPAARPMTGNYLVSISLVGRPEITSDKRRLMADLGAQIERFFADDGDAANCALIWGASFMREWQYRWRIAPQRGLAVYDSGFSYFDEIEPRMRAFMDHPVTNVWGAGPMPIPPGWNPVFSRFGDTLNLALAWWSGTYSTDQAKSFVAAIESELLERD